VRRRCAWRLLSAAGVLRAFVIATARGVRAAAARTIRGGGV